MGNPVVSVSLCCNNPDNGMFTGKFCKVEIGSEVLTLDNRYWPPREPKLSYHFTITERARGFGASRVDGRIKVSRRFFPVIGYRYGWGNWCWDLVMMTPETTIDFINYLKKLGHFQPEHGETRWFNRFEAEGAWFEKDPNTWIRMLHKWGYQAP